MYKIPCECGKVYVGDTGRCTHERIKEDEGDIRLSRTQTSAFSEHANKTRNYPLWDEVKFIDRDPHWYSCRVNEAILLRPSLQCRRFRRARANGFNRESAMLKLPKRGGNGASQGERGRGRGERRENRLFPNSVGSTASKSSPDVSVEIALTCSVRKTRDIPSRSNSKRLPSRAELKFEFRSAIF